MDALELFVDRKLYEGVGRRHPKRSPLDGRRPKPRKKIKAVRAVYVEQRPKYSAWMHSYPGCAMDGG